MKHKIKKYPVKNPLLRSYIKFFWEIQAENMYVYHNLIPVRNIDLKFNLNETPQYLISNGCKTLLDSVYFHGLRDVFTKSQLKVKGNVHVLGICFYPFGMYPFIKIPLSEFRNHMLNASEIGFKKAFEINDKLILASNVSERLNILETELISILDNRVTVSEKFISIFNCVKQFNNPSYISKLCQQQNIHIRKLERSYNKYVGVSARSYSTLFRFQNSLNHLLYKEYEKLSDIAYSHGYFDQMHFLKEFKRFSGSTPKKFANKNNSVLQIGKFS